jgi:ornithine carbamoyltransferase
MSAPRHFLDLDALDTATLRGILDRAAALKKGGNRRRTPPLKGKVLAMIFEKPSTRTRTSFEVAMIQLGGQAITLSPAESQLGRGESVADTARALSCYVEVILLRASRHETLLDLAANAAVPVINGLTDHSHPCQLMADMMTIEERRGPMTDQVVAWSGDGNNVATSWIHAAARFGFELRLACPTALAPDPDVIDRARREGGAVTLTEDPFEAVAGADCVVTDTWVSMGDDPGERQELMEPYRVDSRLMGAAKADALFLHCLPAHRGEEVTGEVIDGPRSAVWDEVGNRLHTQKAILLWCLGA